MRIPILAAALALVLGAPLVLAQDDPETLDGPVVTATVEAEPRIFPYAGVEGGLSLDPNEPVIFYTAYVTSSVQGTWVRGPLILQDDSGVHQLVICDGVLISCTDITFRREGAQVEESLVLRKYTP